MAMDRIQFQPGLSMPENAHDVPILLPDTTTH